MLSKTKHLLLILFLSLSFPVFGEEADTTFSDKPDENVYAQNQNGTDENDDHKEKDFYSSRHKIITNKAQISPKKAHQRTIQNEIKNLNKNKAEFRVLKNQQLKLLQEEYKTLDYRP